MSLPAAKNSAFVSNAFLIFLSRFFPSLANLAVILWFSRRLPREVYGTYTHFWIHLNLMVPVACFGLHVAMMTYSAAQVAALRRSVSRIQMALFVGWILVCAAVFTMLQSGFSAIHSLVPFVYFVVFAAVTILESFLIVHRRFLIVVTTNLLYAAAFTALHYFYGRTELMPLPLFSVLLVALLARFVICAVATATIASPEVNGESNMAPDRSKARSLWLHLGVYDITQNLFTWIDKFLVSLLLTSGLSAMYYNGTVNIPFLPLLINAAGSAILLQFPTGGEETDNSQLLQVLNRSGRMLSCVVFPLFAFLFFLRSDVILFLFSDRYADAIPVFGMSLLVLPLRAYSFTTVLQRHHRGRLINIGSLTDLGLSCILMYPFYLWLGLPGLALSFVVTTYLQAAYYLWVSAGVLQVSPLSLVPILNWALKLVVWGTLFYALHFWMTMRQTVPCISLAAGGILFVLAVVISFVIDSRWAKK